MFPYGKGYYEEMYNIWYNKYNGDIEKTEKKIKQLKALMVHKLIFKELIFRFQIEMISNNLIIDLLGCK